MVERDYLEGTLQPDGTVVLDGKPNVPVGRVQVTLQQLPELPAAGDPFWDMMREIWAGQNARGEAPRSAEEVRAEQQQLRDEWDERQAGIDEAHSGTGQ